MRLPIVALGAALCGALPACGGVNYAIAVSAASITRVEEAKAVGAEQLVPYEYLLRARGAILEQAQLEASEGELLLTP